MFNINHFLMKTLKGMIGNYPDFQVREYALNWYSKGKLTDNDLAEIDALIEAQYIEPEPTPESESESESESMSESESESESESMSESESESTVELESESEVIFESEE